MMEARAVKMPARQSDGRFTSEPAKLIPLYAAAASYYLALEGVARYQGMTPREVARGLVRKGERLRRGLGSSPNFDRDWRRACYARQLALYLANTSHNIPQALLADVVGLSRAAVCMAVRTIEDLRDHGDYETLCTITAVEMGAEA